MGANKDQHYVPQMYLRNFSENGKSIGGYIIKERRFIPDVPIRKTCQRDYLYGKSQEVESWFCSLEQQWSQIIRKIILDEDLLLSKDEWSLLTQFIALSDLRTGYVADKMDDLLSKQFQIHLLTRRQAGEIDFTDDQIKAMHVGAEVPNLVALQNVNYYLELLGDLVPVLIVNKTSRPFITSDYPVIKYNYLFTTRRYYRSYGYGQIGIQIFLPLSPRFCLLSYDPHAYQINNFQTSVKISSATAIEINKMIAQNAKSIIFAGNSARDWVIERYAKGKKDSSQNYNNHILENSDGDLMINYSTVSDFNDYNLSFCAITDAALEMALPPHLGAPLRPEVIKLKEKWNIKYSNIQPRKPDFSLLPQFD